EELVDNEEVPPEVEELESDDDTESIYIDGDKYITVDVYDNEYYAREDEEKHLFALTEHQGDKCVHMRCITLQKAADKLHRPQYTPQEKECLVTYVEVNGHPAWTLWDSESTTMGITPQFAHVNTIRIYELSEPLMLQLGTVGSRAMVQFGMEVKIKVSGHLTKENVTVEDGDEKLAPMASLPANLLAILMSKKEFQETLERGDGLDQPIVIGRKAVKWPDKAHLPKKTHVERVGLESLECQLTSSRVKVEDLMTDKVEEQPQSAASMIHLDITN
ncbi:hypothetical protein C0995_005952, partial [Termitomyces sp. Mi166